MGVSLECTIQDKKCGNENRKETQKPEIPQKNHSTYEVHWESFNGLQPRIFIKNSRVLVISLKLRDQGVKGSRDQGIKGSRDQGIKGSRDQGIKGSNPVGSIIVLHSSSVGGPHYLTKKSGVPRNFPFVGFRLAEFTFQRSDFSLILTSGDKVS